jgi:hypothetical protein
MKKTSVIISSILILFCVNVYAQGVSAPIGPVTRTADVNKDGKSDIIYHKDGEHVGKIEADTNYDGKPDITVHAKNGKFVSAEADTNYDGKPDKKFSDLKEFNEWLNANNPDFYNQLNSRDWDVALLKF